MANELVAKFVSQFNNLYKNELIQSDFKGHVQSSNSFNTSKSLDESLQSIGSSPLIRDKNVASS